LALPRPFARAVFPPFFVDFAREDDRLACPRLVPLAFFFVPLRDPDFALAARCPPRLPADEPVVRGAFAAGASILASSMASGGSSIPGRSMSPFIRSIALLPHAEVCRLHEMCTGRPDGASEIRGPDQKIA
jgi:hypothetical protein